MSAAEAFPPAFNHSSPQQDLPQASAAGPLPATGNLMQKSSLPIEVVILTSEHEIHGLIHVSRETREDRRITDLLNDPVRRFLAVTDARLVSRSGPATPRLYRFLQLHIDTIVMIHPAIQSISAQADYSPEEANRFNDLRARFIQ